MYSLASVYYELKRWDDVEATTRKIIRIDPKHANALNLLGYMFSELDKNLDEAEKLLDRALAIEPENAAFLDSIGWVYYRQGRFKEALVKVQHAATKLPKDAVILDHLGDIYLALHDVEKALLHWKRAAEADPKNEKLKKKIQKHLSKEKKPLM